MKRRSSRFPSDGLSVLSILYVIALIGILIAAISGCASARPPAPPGAREAEVISSQIERSRDGENLYLVTVSYDEVDGVHSIVTAEVDQITFVRCRTAGHLCVVPRVDHAVTIVRCD